MFPVISFWIEIIASKSAPKFIIYSCIFMNLSLLLAYPVFISYKIKSHPLSAGYLMISSTCILLKLISFHHVINDNRSMLRKMASKGTTDPADN